MRARSFAALLFRATRTMLKQTPLMPQAKCRSHNDGHAGRAQVAAPFKNFLEVSDSPLAG